MYAFRVFLKCNSINNFQKSSIKKAMNTNKKNKFHVLDLIINLLVFVSVERFLVSLTGL
jgi:hypothetical protein